MTSEASTTDGIRRLTQVVFDLSKWWWGLATLLRSLALLAGAVGVALPHPLPAFIVIAATVAAELAALRSDRFRAIAEHLLRRLDLRDGLGNPVPASEVADIRARLSQRHLTAAEQGVGVEQYCTSQEQVGPRRLLSCIEESAWWSKHLAWTMFMAYFVAFALLIAVSLAALSVAIQRYAGDVLAEVIATVVTSVVLFALSGSVLKQLIGYYYFEQGSGKSETRAAVLLDGNPSGIDALLVASDYQIRRAAAPPLPTFIWKLRGRRLSHEWALRQKN